MALETETRADGPVILLDTEGGLADPRSPSRDLLIDEIFDDEDFKRGLRAEAARDAGSFGDLDAFLAFCAAYLDRQGGTAGADPVIDGQHARLRDHVTAINQTADRFNTATKTNPDAVFWPNPERGGPLLKDVLPVAKRYPFIDQSTKIGSAGSCFAVEIAQNLIRRDFNYLCLEKTYDPETGTLVMDTSSDNPVVQYSCRWGILFNTPSFTQIVENAFGVRPLPKLLLKLSDAPPIYIDPFREAVMFPSPESYEIEREKHLANTRKVFLESDVFVLTLGLNEAWRYIPGDVYISRNPRNRSMVGLIDHCTLTVEENVDYLQRFIDVVRAHNPGLKLILTVSPVPFLATGRGDTHHVIAANCHSKSVLRVAADIIVERNADVFYFPSFEVVTVCSETIWTADQRHIHPSAVARVMDTFDDMFLTRAAKTLVHLNKAGG
jgi:hypothetical protein